MHWFAGVLQSLCSPSQVARMTLGGEQRRKVLELLAPPPSRHDHSDGGIPRQSGQRFEQAFHTRCRKSVPGRSEPLRPRRLFSAAPAWLTTPGAVDWLTKVAAEMASTPTQRRSVH